MSYEAVPTLALSSAQLAVLRWMLSFPGVEIGWAGEGEARPMWTAYWRDDTARKHMIRVMADWGTPVHRKYAARWPRPNGTPPLHTGTFRALLTRGLLGPSRIRRAGLRTYYGITPEGRRSALSGRAAYVAPPWVTEGLAPNVSETDR